MVAFPPPYKEWLVILIRPNPFDYSPVRHITLPHQTRTSTRPARVEGATVAISGIGILFEHWRMVQCSSIIDEKKPLSQCMVITDPSTCATAIPQVSQKESDDETSSRGLKTTTYAARIPSLLVASMSHIFKTRGRVCMMKTVDDSALACLQST